MFWPSRRILPLNGSRIPAIVLNNVVLPAPFGPKTTYIEGSCSLKLISCKTIFLLYPEDTLFNSQSRHFIFTLLFHRLDAINFVAC